MNNIKRYEFVAELYNNLFNKIGDISEYILDFPQITISATNDIRRTCSLNLKANNTKNGNYIWIDKYIRLSVKEYFGLLEEEFRISNIGFFAVSSVSENFSAEENTLRLECLDFMSLINGTVNGSLLGNSASEYTIQSSSGTIKEILEHIIKSSNIFPISKYDKITIPELYIITDSEQSTSIPNDISIPVTGTYFELIKEVMYCLPNYQFYFDTTGNFIVDKIPTGDDETIVIDKETMNDIVINYERNLDYGKIKNEIEIYGSVYNADCNLSISYVNNHTGYVVIDQEQYDALKSENSSRRLIFTISKNNTIIVNNSEIDISDVRFDTIVIQKYEDYDLYNYVTSASKTNLFTINIGFSIIEHKSNITLNYNPNDGLTPICSCFSIDVLKNSLNSSYNMATLEFLPFQPYCKIVENNINSPFHRNKIGTHRLVCYGGEYDNITSQQLAIDRAKYELYSNCRLNDTITVNCISDYNLDVNNLIEFETEEKIFGENDSETNMFIVKEISHSENGVMNLTLMRYYPNLEEIS